MANWGRNMLWKKNENIYEIEVHCDGNSDTVREIVQQGA
jgi:hypothetical protein